MSSHVSSSYLLMVNSIWNGLVVKDVCLMGGNNTRFKFKLPASKFQHPPLTRTIAFTTKCPSFERHPLSTGDAPTVFHSIESFEEWVTFADSAMSPLRDKSSL
ncbi:hypothetical protein CDAR_618021 [Caerostris darwini]|uniref:Uncharacterized protein n=1 Tax=Caerostris darwini TaxID=1538125 RepID=A0AAV4U8X9_9ARAC|nr:hypothetical protein CDAR_618021 [Caerostris darwini]